MTTLDHLVSRLNQNSDLIAPITAFLDAFDAISQGCDPQQEGFASAEHALLEAARTLSTDTCATLLGAWDAPAPPVMIHKGQRFTRTRRSTKTYQGLDGPVTVSRWLYHAVESGESLCPLELRAGLIEGILTPAAARMELMSAASDDYRKAVSLHGAAYVLKRSKSSLERDVIEMGKRLEEALPVLEQTRRQVLTRVEGVASISVSVDRTGLPFEEPIARKPGRPKKDAPAKPCQCVHRQVYCACLVLHDAQGEALMTQRFASHQADVEAMLRQASACLDAFIEMYPEAKRVGLCDGAPEMKRRVRQVFGEHEIHQELVDAWHAASYVSKAFGALGYSEEERREMVRRLVVNKTGVKWTLTRLRTGRLEHGKLKEVEEAITYLENHGDRMGYAQAREQGLPIGSGSVEATCKCVVAVRFKRCGARWKVKGAEPLLKVRAWLTSDQDVWRTVYSAFTDSYVVKLAS